MKKLLLTCLISALVSSAFGQALEIKASYGANSFHSLSNSIQQFKSAYGVRFRSEIGNQFSFGINYRTNERWAFGTELYFVDANFKASNRDSPFQEIKSQEAFQDGSSYTPVQSVNLMLTAKYAVFSDKAFRVEAKYGLGFSANGTIDFFEANTRGEFVGSGGWFSLVGSNAPRDFRFTQTGNALTTLLGIELTLQPSRWLGLYLEPCYLAQPFKRVQLTEHFDDRDWNSNLPESKESTAFNLNNFQLNAGLKFIISTKLKE